MIMNTRRVINIRYAQIRSLDLSNGEEIGVALFVQGCRFRCPNCFNPETWDFNGGKEWTEEIEKQILELAARPYIKRISILGGEPLADENLDGILNLVNKIRLLFGDMKTIWLYTGYLFSELFMYDKQINKNKNYLRKDIDELYKMRQEIVKRCDVLIDGRYIDLQRDITKKWAGSSNQRVIDIQQSIHKGEIVLWET